MTKLTKLRNDALGRVTMQHITISESKGMDNGFRPGPWNGKENQIYTLKRKCGIRRHRRQSLELSLGNSVVP